MAHRYSVDIASATRSTNRGWELRSCNVCTVCKTIANKNNIFLWTKCNHTYCVRCASNVINKFLASQNKIPKCKFTNCNQSLDNYSNNNINSLLLEEYQIKLSIIEYDRINLLLYGYIRYKLYHQTKYKNFSIIYQTAPQCVIELICDYYNLNFAKKIECYHCDSTGYIYEYCTRCFTNGKYKILCDKCNDEDNDSFIKECIYCIKCDGTGFLNKICEECNGDGIRCFKCNIFKTNKQLLVL